MLNLLKNKEELDYIIENDFVGFVYRKKYNLPFNDERYLKSNKLQLELDLTLMNLTDKKIKEIQDRRKKVQLEEDFGFDIEEKIDLNDNFSDEDIEKFMDDDLNYELFDKEE